jgi:hypothetical protein
MRLGMFSPTHLFISKEGNRAHVELLQEVKNFIFVNRDYLDRESIVEFDFNKYCQNKNYVFIKIMFVNNRIYIPIDRIVELQKIIGYELKNVLEMIDEEMVDMA